MRTLIKLASALLCAIALLPNNAKADTLQAKDLLLEEPFSQTAPLSRTNVSSTGIPSADLLIPLDEKTDLDSQIDDYQTDEYQVGQYQTGSYQADETLSESQQLTAQAEETNRESINYPSLPSVEEIQLLQEDLRNLDVAEPVRRRRRAYPSITIYNPSGYGAHRGQVYIGASIQSRSRFSGPREELGVFGGGKRDGIAGIGFGVGDARESVGVQLSYTAASFGGSRAPFSGGLNAKVHKQFGNGWAAAVGGEGIINFGRLPDDDDEIEFNDFEGTYYGAASYTIPLREDFDHAFSRLTLTGGAGTGRFRTMDQIIDGEFAVGVFGSAALQVLPSTTLITEWTGQDLAVGASFAPFPNFPIVVTPAFRDLAGEGDGTPRFILGIGMSVSDAIDALK